MQLLSIVTVTKEHYYDCKSNQNYSNSSIQINRNHKNAFFPLFFDKGCVIFVTFVGEMNKELRWKKRNRLCQKTIFQRKPSVT